MRRGAPSSSTSICSCGPRAARPAGRPRRGAVSSSVQVRRRAQLPQRSVDVVLPLADDADERAVPHQLTPGGLPAQVEVGEPGPRGRRAQHPAVQQARRGAGRRGSAAGPAPCRAGRAAARSRPTARRGGAGPATAVAVRSVAGSSAAIRVDVPASARAGRGPGQRPDDGTDVAQGRAGLEHREAAGGEALVGAGRRVRARPSGSPLTGSPSASAAIWASAVRMPWPSSTLPTWTCRPGRRRTDEPRPEAGVGDDVGGQRRRAWRVLRARPGGDDGVDDPALCAAAAQVALQRLGDLLGVGVRLLLEQRRGTDHDAGDAEAALGGLVVEDRLLHGMRRGRLRRVPRPCVTSAVATCHNGVWQDGTTASVEPTKQAPHRPCPQPNRLPTRPSSSRSDREQRGVVVAGQRDRAAVDGQLGHVKTSGCRPSSIRVRRM